MDRLLTRLERSLGRFAIQRLITYIVAGMGIVFVLAYVRPEILDYLTLDPSRALKEPWRFVTFLFLPTTFSLIWVLFSLYWTWLIGTNLEQEWGAFKLNVYYLLGVIGTTAVAWMTKQPVGNFWLNTSLFFAFATIFPDYEIVLFFIVPIRVKWLALLTLGLLGYSFLSEGLGVQAAIVVALGNYLLFFAGHLVRLARGKQIELRQAARRSSLRPEPGREEKSSAAAKACALCGARQDEGADIRVCSCEKCGGPRELCLEHARNH